MARGGEGARERDSEAARREAAAASRRDAGTVEAQVQSGAERCRAVHSGAERCSAWSWRCGGQAVAGGRSARAGVPRRAGG
jgi:hypothetical protein